MSLLAKIFHSILDVIITFLSLFVPLNGKCLIFNSTGNINYNFNSKFLFEFFNSIQNSDYECFFVINDKATRVLLKEKNIPNIISSTSFKNKLLIAQAKVWVCSTIESPMICLCKNSERIVYHLGHGIPLKNIGMAEKNIPLLKKLNRFIKLRLFTHVTCYSDFFEDVLYKAFNKNDEISYLKLGQPRNDFLMSDIEKNSSLLFSLCEGISSSNYKSAKKILYCPTWRSYATTRFFPFDDLDADKLGAFLEQNNMILYLREHPYFSSNIPSEILTLSRVISLNSQVLTDITPYLSEFDLLITDYSSIFIDYYITGGPVMFIPYDLKKYESITGFSKPYKDIAIGTFVSNFSDFMLALLEHKKNINNTQAYLQKLNIKASGNCLEHYKKIVSLLEANS